MNEIMEEVAVSQASQKAMLKQKIRSLEEEKSLLENEILSLKEKLELFELERKSDTLVSEVGSLEVEKTLLEEKVSSYYATQEERQQGEEPVSDFAEVSTSLAEATSEISAIKEVEAQVLEDDRQQRSPEPTPEVSSAV